MAVPIKDKKAFLQHFLKNYTLRARTGRWILALLLEDVDKLKRAHFTDDVSGYQNSIVMCTECIGRGVTFKALWNGEEVEPEKMFHMMKHLDNGEEVYIHLQFKKPLISPLYWNVLESREVEPELSTNDKRYIEKLMKKSLSDNRGHIISILIDDALDTGNKDRFMMLSKLKKESNGAK